MGSSLLCQAIVSEDWQLVLDAIQFYPASAQKWRKRYGFFDGWSTSRVLPIHEALVANAPFECILAITESYPEALRQRETSFHRLPIHCACRANAEPNVIRYLAEQYRESLGVSDLLSRVPLHYTLTNGANPEVINILLDAYPQAARACDVFGWTIVHVAVAVGAPTEIVQRLLEQSPESVVMKTNRGKTVRAVILKSCRHGQELRALITRVQNRVETTMHLPRLDRKFSASRMVMT